MDNIGQTRSGFMCGQVAVDFANIFKAFVGANYLSVSFMFSQSGLLLGIIGILVISCVEGHCCSLIVKCKRLAIHKILESREDWLNSTIEAVENPSRLKLRKKVERRLTYSDVAWIGAGKWGSRVVTFMLLFTQFGFCIGYLIFLGNTVRKFFPMIQSTISFPALTLSPALSSTAMSPISTMHTTMVQNSTTSLFPTNQTSLLLTTLNSSSTLLNYFTTANPSFLDSSISTDNMSTMSFMTSNSSSLNPSSSYPVHLYYIIVAVFVPFFATLALVRNIRHLGAGSMVANFSILIGYISIMAYILRGFQVSHTVELANWSTFPIFIGGISSAYEGIGVIIPIESSMEHTRRWFHQLLLTVIMLATLILSTIGILGYLRFGNGTEQTIIWNMTADTAFPLVVYSVVSVGVIFTFPLQNFPVIEICEGFLFAEGGVFGPAKMLEVGDANIQTETSPLLDSQDEVDPEMLAVLQKLPVAVTIPDSFNCLTLSIQTIKLNLQVFNGGDVRAASSANLR
ncbi:proton-coupled amino acid transporter 1-like isoform X2 [Amphiura filiformis]|uniref:proton-coupled amino acid transporter 1-like isoform X2 n=1 Tax=Amphiura filiformis TaxID=82378 RepID=UPI003B213644